MGWPLWAVAPKKFHDEPGTARVASSSSHAAVSVAGRSGIE